MFPALSLHSADTGQAKSPHWTPAAHVRQKKLVEGLVFTLTDVFTTALTDANTNGLFPTDLTYLEEYLLEI